MSYSYTECRAEGHEWKHQERLLGGIATGTVGLVSVCNVCGMKRERWIARNGQAQSPRYTQPEGYRTTGDERRTTQEWRRTHVAALFTTKGKK